MPLFPCCGGHAYGHSHGHGHAHGHKAKAPAHGHAHGPDGECPDSGHGGHDGGAAPAAAGGGLPIHTNLVLVAAPMRSLPCSALAPHRAPASDGPPSLCCSLSGLYRAGHGHGHGHGGAAAADAGKD
eukprot:SAG22_NODE_8290_length_667_cov_0.779930_1_plen_126_part_01